MMSFEPWLEFFVETFALLVMIVSLFGLIIPVFPGTFIIWLVALLYGLASGFGWLGGISFAILTVLMVAASLADNVLMGKKARDSGASWLSIGLALGAGILGTLFFPPLGGVIGAPLVLYASEWNRVRDHDRALSTVKALALGWGWAFVVRFGIGGVMILLWAVWAFSS